MLLFTAHPLDILGLSLEPVFRKCGQQYYSCNSHILMHQRSISIHVVSRPNVKVFQFKQFHCLRTFCIYSCCITIINKLNSMVVGELHELRKSNSNASHLPIFQDQRSVLGDGGCAFNSSSDDGAMQVKGDNKAEATGNELCKALLI